MNMSESQRKSAADGIGAMIALLFMFMVALTIEVIDLAAERRQLRQHQLQQNLGADMAKVDGIEYTRKAVGPNLFSWQPENPFKHATFLVEEKDGVVGLIGILPKGKVADKVALKIVKAVYKDQGLTVDFHKDFSEMKKHAPL